MQYNLLEEKWIPVVRRSGEKEFIAPYQVTDKFDTDPILRVASPRHDFNGALVQFLIGLYQSSLIVVTNRDHRRLKENVPDVSFLYESIMPLRNAFNLLGDGPLFMQDYDSALDGEANSILRLLIDAPGEESEKKNIDFFVKRQFDVFISPAAAATALFTLQLNAPAGGQGHRTSIRGGGPLTTLVVGQSLWEMVVKNMSSELSIKTPQERDELISAKCFPWMSLTQTSEGDQIVYPEDVHKLQIYWAMPRRIRLIKTNQPSNCPIYPQINMSMSIGSYVTKNYGANYSSTWKHPLTPYRKKEDDLITLKPNAQGISFRDWLGISYLEGEFQPAEAVLNNRIEDSGINTKLWAFGYAMDKMKPLNWVESYMPLFMVEHEKEYVHFLKELIDLFVKYQKMLDAACKDAKGGSSDKRRLKEVKVPDDLGRQYLNSVENLFFEIANEAAHKGEESFATLTDQWLSSLRKSALEIFDNYFLRGPFLGVEVQFVFKARVSLVKRINKEDALKRSVSQIVQNINQ